MLLHVLLQLLPVEFLPCSLVHTILRDHLIEEVFRRGGTRFSFISH